MGKIDRYPIGAADQSHNQPAVTERKAHSDRVDAGAMQHTLECSGDAPLNLQWMKRLCDASLLGMVISDAQDNCIYTNAAFRKITGLTMKEALGTQWINAVHPEDWQRVLSGRQVAARNRKPFQSEIRVVRRCDGSVVWTRLNAAVAPNRGEQNISLLIVEDIVARKSVGAELQAAEEALFAEKERTQVTLDSIGDAVLTTDQAGKVTYLNLEAETMTGWSHDEALGRPLAEVFRIIDGTTPAIVMNAAQQVMDENQTVGLAMGCTLVRRDGSEVEIEDSVAPIQDRNGVVTGAVIMFHDAAQSRTRAEQMEHPAWHDFLTGLPNSALLTERLSQAIGLARRNHRQVAVLFLDLDDFKFVNDSFGHLIGDQLLQTVAARLQTCVRTTDTICRCGGDEFVILLAEITRSKDAAQVAEQVIASLTEPQSIEGIEVRVSASVGISVYPDHGDDPVTLMQCADTAMYQAKASGRNGYRFFAADCSRRRD